MEMMRIYGLFALLLVIHFCTPASASNFRDWTVGCDNIKGCTAIGFPQEDQDGSGSIRVERAGGPDARPKIRLFLYAAEAKNGPSLRLTADGAPIAGVAAEREARTEENVEGYAIEISPQEQKPFIAALRKSQALNLATTDGKSKVDISLAGAVAALRNVDDIQGRIGTQTALIEVGDKPASAVPDAPALPVIVPQIARGGFKVGPALAAKLRNRIAKENPDDCDQLPDGGSLSDETWPLNNSQTLVELACSLGAYNLQSDFWIVTSGDVAKAAPASFEAPGEKPGNRLFNVEFDRKTATLSFFYKGRGVGDCGDAGKYVWTGKGFALLEYSAMGTCRGVSSDDWPVLWRARLK
jgi:hypothetical protein